METLIVKIKGNTTKAKNMIAFFRDLAKVNKEISIIDAPLLKSHIAKSISAGLHDVKAIMEGNQKPKTLKEMLDED